MALAEFLKRLFGRDQATGAVATTTTNHHSEFSRPKKDATPEEAERRNEHIQRDRERREERKRR